MSVKVIAIGNCLMGNDGIGLHILEKIDNCLKAYGIETFFGETDVEYSLSIINNNDFIFIIDAVILGGKLGEITITPIDKYDCQIKNYTQHLYSLIDLVHIYNRDIIGFLIGVEVENLTYSLALSINLEMMLKDISIKVLDTIIAQLPQIAFTN